MSDASVLTPPPKIRPAPQSVGVGGRLALVGGVVFAANAGLLVLQLVAGRLLSPFVGSSLETWTAVIAAFLAGIALGNAFGGRLADRGATAGKLALWLFGGAIAAVWLMLLPMLLNATDAHTALPLGPRIPVLAFLLCFPAGFALSVLTPLSIRIGVPDVARTGSVAGLIFALSTLGCLVGNYLTGFVLVPEFTVNQIVIGTAAVLGMLAAAVLAVRFQPIQPTRHRAHPAMMPELPPTDLKRPAAFAGVFLCSFAGMTLELAATRLLAPVIGVSIYTWTGVIGVMLAGTCLGNWLGGWISARTRIDRKLTVAWCMTAAALAGVGILVLFGLLTQRRLFADLDLVPQVLAWTFALFFLPSLLLGTVSPQVIRLAVPDLESAGRTAGRVYAWSTAGAIAGTFATGYVLISSIGVMATILLAAALPVAAVVIVAGVKQAKVLYGLCVAGGALVGGSLVLMKADTGITAESNYYAIIVRENQEDGRELRTMALDLLVHSVADLNDPTFLHYKHEQFQLEAVYAAKDAHADSQRVLVIGGGGYTFPRCVRTKIPTAAVDVVEIDPAVTRVAYSHLGLDPKLGVNAFHMDGRQFVAEKAEKGAYHVVTLDAVNDFSVPYHLLTKECNEAVKATLTDDGLYLVTVIDEVANGKLWKAAYHTLKESFPEVALTFPKGAFDPQRPEKLEKSVIVLYAANRPIEPGKWAEMMQRQTGGSSGVYVAPAEVTDALLARDKKLILTDQFAPVDNLLMQVFRTRKGGG
ncbi:MAG: fused MFS/spermidine synthase [Fimbriiglobus sp.]|nr:fused MFS/spermidine synthase [Fimbriiglobus sp.]